MIDVIIPVFNEEQILVEQEVYYQKLSKLSNVIFVDGQSEDNTAKVAARYGTVIDSLRGRSIQKNNGFKASSSDHLVFLHVDSLLDLKQIPQLENEFKNEKAGCFTLCIDDKRSVFRLYEKIVNFRASKQGIIDGDCGMWLNRSAFESIGGFDDIPVCEDLEFSKKLRKKYKIKALDIALHVSSRKWREEGFVKTFLRYSLAYVQIWTGIRFFK